MRVSFQKLHGNKCELDISPDSSFDYVTNELMTKHGMPHGRYIYILKGVILKGERPFENVHDGDTVFYVIKDIQNPTSKPNPTLEPTPVPVQKKAESVPQPKPAPEQKLPPVQKETSPPAKATPQTVQRDQSIETTMNLTGALQALRPENSIWENPQRVNEIEDILEENPSLGDVIGDFVRLNYSQASRSLQMPEQLLGLIRMPPLRTAQVDDDFNVLYQGLTNQQRDVFNSLMQVTQVDRLTAIQYFITSDYDPNVALSLMETL